MDSGIYFDEPPTPRRRRRFRPGWVFVALLAVALWVGSQLSSPYLIERPGPVFNVLGTEGDTPVISIVDAKSYPTDGALDLLTVNLVGSPTQTPSWLEILGAWLDPAQSIVPVEEVFPATTSTQDVEKQNALMMSDSQSQATAAALRSLGYRYSYRVFVDSVDPKAAAKGLIKAGDYIDSIDGKRVTGINGLRALVAAAHGSPVTVKGVRGGKDLQVQVTPKLVGDAWRLGVYVGTKFEFPVQVQLRLNDVGGPSGGMMFALGIYDKMTPGALTGGQIIAGTGTIDETGVVGPIGGITQKMYGAQRAGARWFLAPAENCGDVVGHIPAGLKVLKVANFNQALTAVKQIATEQSASGLPTCSK
jgi:PDZ domain-containing protein